MRRFETPCVKLFFSVGFRQQTIVLWVRYVPQSIRRNQQVAAVWQFMFDNCRLYDEARAGYDFFREITKTARIGTIK